ncbi:hypothetical protein AB0P36_22800 [Streptomyces flavidovirens]|uniref:hypothetical protein n=1 Tax=Streptomyces flavidovirens TaxID=67298 RepID=UPI0034216C83
MATYSSFEGMRKWFAIGIAAILAAGGLSIFGAGQASAAAKGWSCSLDQSIAKKKVTSKCVALPGPGMDRSKTRHRAAAYCAMERGQGTIHTINVWLHGPWKPFGQNSSVTCPLKSFLIIGKTNLK